MEVFRKDNDFSMANIYNWASDISNNLYHHRGNIVIDASFTVNGPVLIEECCDMAEYYHMTGAISDICLNEISKQLNIHIERLSVISIHNNEEVKLKPKEFLIDLTQPKYDKILKPEKIYQHCVIIQDSIQENIYHECFNKKLFNKRDNIFIFDNIITNEKCDHIIETMETYFKRNDYMIEKWENTTNTNCIYKYYINELDSMIFNIIDKIVKKMNNYNIICNGDSGYCYRKIFGPTKIHIDGIYVEKNKEYIPNKQIRNMALIICLNEDYECGEFYFPYQDKKIKLKKGNVLLFPPYWTHPHMTYPLLNNTYRYSINTWLYE